MNDLTIKDRDGQTSVAIGMRVWIMAGPQVPRNIVNATGTIESVTASGRVKVRFDPDDEIVRRLNIRGIIIAPAALTNVNPFQPAVARA